MSPSLSRIAEDLVRSSRDGRLQWQGFVLSTHFQPIYSVRDPACVGFEALLRALDRDGAPIRADRLFEQAGAAGDGFLLDWICRALHLRQFAMVDPGEPRLHINVHPDAAAKDLRCARELEQLARFYGLAPRRVCIEIQEGACADEGLLRESVAVYRAMGAAVAMDDFGLGRSNFDRIASLGPDVVNVDRAILAESVGPEKALRMLPSVIGMLHQAGAKVTVVGVESAGEAMLAIDAGADHLQGYYFAAPAAALPAEADARRAVTDLLRMAGARLAAVGA